MERRRLVLLHRRAREFKLRGSDAASRVKKYDKQVASDSFKRSFKGKKSGFCCDLAGAIDEVFKKKDTQTYREAAVVLDLPKSTLYDYATKEMDFRCLNQRVRPMPSESNRAKRIETGMGARVSWSKSTPPVATAWRAACRVFRNSPP